MRVQEMKADRGESAGFTLAELIAVVALMGLFAAMLLPALAETRADSKSFVCRNNLKRLMLAWSMYATQNNENLLRANSWVGNSFLDWTTSAANTNTVLLLDPSQSTIATCVKAADLFKCPADTYLIPATSNPRTRSYSLSAAAGGVGLTPGSNPQYPLGRTYSTVGAVKLSQLNTPGPQNTVLFLDEHPDSINDGSFAFNAGYAPAQYSWRDLPASYHDGACNLSFADGHVEKHLWQDSRTVLPVLRTTRWWSLGVLSIPQSVDYAWMNDRVPYQQ
jgi:prepilin-type processing-associated H-X9-DG protein/prepilin-type N-terminal cleavage/methylation domain-containing protein